MTYNVFGGTFNLFSNDSSSSSSNSSSSSSSQGEMSVKTFVGNVRTPPYQWPYRRTVQGTTTLRKLHSLIKSSASE